MQTDVLVAHFALDFRLGRKCRHRVNYKHVNRAGIDELLSDVESLLAVVGLRYPEVVDIHAQFFGIETVESVLGIDDCADAALLLRLGNHMYRKGGLA